MHVHTNTPVRFVGPQSAEEKVKKLFIWCAANGENKIVVTALLYLFASVCVIVCVEKGVTKADICL